MLPALKIYTGTYFAGQALLCSLLSTVSVRSDSVSQEASRMLCLTTLSNGKTVMTHKDQADLAPRALAAQVASSGLWHERRTLQPANTNIWFIASA